MGEVLPWCAVAFLLGALSGITLTIVLLRRAERRYERESRNDRA
jgi:hypothetical protein